MPTFELFIHRLPFHERRAFQDRTKPLFGHWAVWLPIVVDSIHPEQSWVNSRLWPRARGGIPDIAPLPWKVDSGFNGGAKAWLTALSHCGCSQSSRPTIQRWERFTVASNEAFWYPIIQAKLMLFSNLKYHREKTLDIALDKGLAIRDKHVRVVDAKEEKPANPPKTIVSEKNPGDCLIGMKALMDASIQLVVDHHFKTVSVWKLVEDAKYYEKRHRLRFFGRRQAERIFPSLPGIDNETAYVVPSDMSPQSINWKEFK